MEHPRAPLLPTPRLLGVQEPPLTAARYAHHIPYLGACARASDGLHYEKISWLRLLRDDAADAHRHGPEEQVCEGQNAAEQCPILVQYGFGAEYGESDPSIGLRVANSE